MNKSHIEAFLSHLAVHGEVAAATQNQAFNAILFLYRKVLDLPLEENIHAIPFPPNDRNDSPLF